MAKSSIASPSLNAASSNCLRRYCALASYTRSLPIRSDLIAAHASFTLFFAE
jgi:hypothetical protein